jgi:hypothetical protein
MFAYIDPNTGGMIFQALAVAAATISGAFFFFSNKIRMAAGRIRRVLRRAQRDRDDVGQPT